MENAHKHPPVSVPVIPSGGLPNCTAKWTLPKEWQAVADNGHVEDKVSADSPIRSNSSDQLAILR